MPPQLDDVTHEREKMLCAEGDSLAESQRYNAAIEKYEAALMLLPKPESNWDAATWIFTAIGDAYFLLRDYRQAYAAFSNATHWPGGVGNPFIHLRLGEIQLELGNEIVAADELTRAYMGAGRKIFEDEPPKYFDLLKKKLKCPPEGW